MYCLTMDLGLSLNRSYLKKNFQEGIKSLGLESTDSVERLGLMLNEGSKR